MKKGKIVIKHHGIIILRDNQVRLVSSTPYLSVADGGLEGIIDNEKVTNMYNENVKSLMNESDYDDKDIHWKKVEKSFADMNLNYERILRLIRELRGANSTKDLDRIYQIVLSGLNIQSRNEVEKAYKVYPELVLSMMAKGIIKGYANSQMKRTNPSKIIVLQNRKIKGEDLYDIMQDAFELDLTEKSTNGVDKVLEKSFSDELDKAYQRISSSCFDCANGYVSCCEKMADYPVKKDISEYPFITDGFQVYVNNELDKFIVTRCHNFKKASQKVYLTPFQQGRIKNAKALIELLYRDVETLAEAREIEDRNKSLGYH